MDEEEDNTILSQNIRTFGFSVAFHHQSKVDISGNLAGAVGMGRRSKGRNYAEVAAMDFRGKSIKKFAGRKMFSLIIKRGCS